jgi:hypothetical protein
MLHLGDPNSPHPKFDRSAAEQAPKPFVYWLLEVLLSAKISLRGEVGRVPQEELNLFDLATRGLTWAPRARSIRFPANRRGARYV